MQIFTQRTFTVTLTENEASILVQFLDDVVIGRTFTPDTVKQFHSALNTELMECEL